METNIYFVEKQQQKEYYSEALVDELKTIGYNTEEAIKIAINWHKGIVKELPL